MDDEEPFKNAAFTADVARRHFADLAELHLGFEQIFFAQPLGIGPSLRHRYAHALLQLNTYLEKQNFPGHLRKELIELSAALMELDSGTQRHFLKPERGEGTSRLVGPSNVWSCRAMLAIAIAFLVERGRMTKRAATDHVVARAADLESVLPSSKTNDFKRLVSDWHSNFMAGKIANDAAKATFNNRIKLFEKAVQGADPLLFANEIVDTALLMASRLSDHAAQSLTASLRRSTAD